MWTGVWVLGCIFVCVFGCIECICVLVIVYRCLRQRERGSMYVPHEFVRLCVCACGCVGVLAQQCVCDCVAFGVRVCVCAKVRAMKRERKKQTGNGLREEKSFSID